MSGGLFAGLRRGPDQAVSINLRPGIVLRPEPEMLVASQIFSGLVGLEVQTAFTGTTHGAGEGTVLRDADQDQFVVSFYAAARGSDTTLAGQVLTEIGVLENVGVRALACASGALSVTKIASLVPKVLPCWEGRCRANHSTACVTGGFHPMSVVIAGDQKKDKPEWISGL